MPIKDGRLLEAIWKPSPNKGGKILKHQYLVAHYTAGRSAANSANWLCSKAAKASAHLIIGREGSLYQLVNFDSVAWHAGPSAWGKLTGLNNFSIGIELDNPGFVVKDGAGKWRSLALGVTYENHDVVVDERGMGWVTYTVPQLTLLEQVGLEIIEAYPSLKDIVGHSDICVPAGRKPDPGFAYPAESIRSKLFGRA